MLLLFMFLFFLIINDPRHYKFNGSYFHYTHSWAEKKNRKQCAKRNSFRMQLPIIALGMVSLFHSIVFPSVKFADIPSTCSQVSKLNGKQIYRNNECFNFWHCSLLNIFFLQHNFKQQEEEAIPKLLIGAILLFIKNPSAKN